MSKTVVVTGFGPFGEHETNASSETVKVLQTTGLDIDGVNLVTMEMPVHYEKVSQIVPQLWEEHKPALVVHCGVHGSARVVILEACARNQGHFHPDIDGCQPGDGRCESGPADSLNCCLDIDKLSLRCAELAGERQLPVAFEKSDDAGRYLCNFAYYKSLHLKRGCSLFVHVPPLDKPYSREQLAQAVCVIVKACLEAMDEE